MLLVDRRAGSCELVRPLQKLGLEVEETDLEFGDIAFTGRGIGGKPVQVGIEFKKLGECIASLRTERLQGHQAPGMQDAYDFRWLLVEGELHIDKAGLLQRRVGKREFKPIPGRMTLSEYWKRLNTLHLCYGLNPMQTTNQVQTLKWLEVMYRTWTDQTLDGHTSHLAIYKPEPITINRTLVRQMALDLPGIGWGKSDKVAQHFGTVLAMVNATEAEWLKIEGIGHGLARQTVQALRSYS